MSNLLLPVGMRTMSSWATHQRRSPRSSEPGTDFYCPIGTPIYAPGDGQVYGSGNTIGPATGRWVGIDLDNGMRFRCMHLSRLVMLPKRVKRGDLIGYSGASGYGKEDWSKDPHTGGAHTHVTLWPTHASRFGYDAQGRPFTVDFMNYVGGSPAGGGSISPEEDDMFTDQDRQRGDAVYAAVFGPRNIEAAKINWASQDGNKEAVYGLLDIMIYTQQLVIAQTGQLAAMAAAVAQLKGGGAIDMKALTAAAERGAKDALSGMVLTADVEG